MLDKQKILEAALEGITRYVDQYNDDNDSQVAVSLAGPEFSDNGAIEIDGGNIHGAWTLMLGEL